MVWGFPEWGPLAEYSASKLKGGQLNVCTVYVYVYVYSFPPCGRNLCEVGRQFLSLVDKSIVWFGRMSDISQLALHYLAQGEGQVGGLRSLPLMYRYKCEVDQ